jgi:hypothetical protein
MVHRLLRLTDYLMMNGRTAVAIAATVDTVVKKTVEAFSLIVISVECIVVLPWFAGRDCPLPEEYLPAS